MDTANSERSRFMQWWYAHSACSCYFNTSVYVIWRGHKVIVILVLKVVIHEVVLWVVCICTREGARSRAADCVKGGVLAVSTCSFTRDLQLLLWLAVILPHFRAKPSNACSSSCTKWQLTIFIFINSIRYNLSFLVLKFTLYRLIFENLIEIPQFSPYIFTARISRQIGIEQNQSACSLVVQSACSLVDQSACSLH